MRLSDHIKNTKTAPVPPPTPNTTPASNASHSNAGWHSIADRPATAAQKAPGGAVAPAYSGNRPTPAIAGFPLRNQATPERYAQARAASSFAQRASEDTSAGQVGGQVAKTGVARATKAGSIVAPVSSLPPTNKNLFRLSDLIIKKHAAPAAEQAPAPAPAPAPVAEHAPEPTPAPTPAPMTEHKPEPAPEPLPENEDSTGPEKEASDSAPARNVIPTSPRVGISGGAAKTSAALKETANVSRYENHLSRIHEICKQFGIAVPDDRTEVLEQARACLVTVYKKILLPAAEKHTIWPMLKSIAADLEGIIAADTNVCTILHRYRVKDEKLVWHSLYTAILAMDLVKNEENLPCSICEMGGAALIHDIDLLLANGYNSGKHEDAADSSDQINKGIELARKIEVPDIVLTMISKHHCRLDRQGYPKDLSPAKLERCSQIIAIASIFEHAILDFSMENVEAASGSAGKANETGIAKVFRKYRKVFDIDLLKKMIALVGFYPVGSMVELNNRTICQVVKQNRDFPVRPVVKVIIDSGGNHPETEQLIDLKQVKILSILCAIARPTTT